MRRKLGVVIIALFIMVGCSANEASDPMSNMDHSTPPTERSAPQESLASPVAEVKSYKLEAKLDEVDGEYSIIVNTDLLFSEEHYNQAHQFGEGHIHFYVNGGLKGPIMGNGPFPVDPSLLVGGDNVLKLTLAGNDHSEPYGASVELTIVK